MATQRLGILVRSMPDRAPGAERSRPHRRDPDRRAGVEGHAGELDRVAAPPRQSVFGRRERRAGTRRHRLRRLRRARDVPDRRRRHHPLQARRAGDAGAAADEAAAARARAGGVVNEARAHRTMRTSACSDRAARCRRAPLARAFAALLVAVFAGLATPDADHAAFAQTQSQPAREAPAPAASLLPTQAERERFQALAEELRCLVCQNQTLADSDAALAADLRREVEELMLAGRSDDQIKAHLVQRYGDFVLYRPPMQRNT